MRRAAPAEDFAALGGDERLGGRGAEIDGKEAVSYQLVAQAMLARRISR